MKNKLIAIAAALALAVILARVFEKPLLAQIRAALMQNVDEPGRNAFALQSDGSLDRPTVAQFTVPAGKRYVIENVSALFHVPNSTYLASARVVATFGGTNIYMTAPAHLEYTVSAGTNWAASGTTHLYADPGTTIYVAAVNAGGEAPQDLCSFYASGYVTNTP